MGKKIVGPISCTVAGERIAVSGDFEVSLTSSTRETVTAADGTTFYKETPTSPHITVTAYVTDEFNIESFLADGLEVHLSCASGTYSLHNAHLVEAPVLTGGESTVSLTFEGSDITKQG